MDMGNDLDFFAKTDFKHDTIHTEYHNLYNKNGWVRVKAYEAENDRNMRECMSNRENYDLEMVRRVVGHWADVCPNGSAHKTALSILAEREAELVLPTMIVASIKRTEPKQVKQLGVIAWSDMRFCLSHSSVDTVARYCKQLAQRDGIINPEIVITLS